MKSILFAKSKDKAKLPPVGDEVPQFVRVGEASGHVPADAMEKLAAFYAKYPRRALRKGEKGVVESVREMRDRP